MQQLHDVCGAMAGGLASLCAQAGCMEGDAMDASPQAHLEALEQWIQEVGQCLLCELEVGALCCCRGRVGFVLLGG